MILSLAWLFVLSNAWANTTVPEREDLTTVSGSNLFTNTFCGSEDCSNITSDANDTFFYMNVTAESPSLKNENESWSTVYNISTVATTTTISTTPLPTRTTTFVPLKPSIPKADITAKDPCSCDTIRGACNINCCCDSDCSDSDRKAFSHCVPEPEVDHSGLCYKEQFIYTNNTRYKVVRGGKGLFCIARDNFPERLFFSNQKTIHTTYSFNRAMKRRKQFAWLPRPIYKSDAFESTLPYKSGMPVWIYNDVTGLIKSLEIPLPSGTAYCKSTRTVKYLEEFDSKCLHQTITRQECEDPQSTLNGQLFCENVVLVSSPLLINQTKIEGSPEEAFTSLRSVLCEDYESCTEETKNITAPSYDSMLNSCNNTLSSIQYVIYHNSTHGIVDAECQMILNSVPLGKPFTQQHSVIFKWAKNKTGAFPRSGMPGYLQGKPLISGSLHMDVADSVKREIVNISSFHRDWFGLPVANKDGVCSGKTNVLFKENLKTQCTLHISTEALVTQEGCSLLKTEIWNTVFGDMKVNKSDPRQLKTLVSAFGDPAPQTLDDWVPIFLDRPFTDTVISPPCTTQISGVQFRILYSYFGPFSNPQMKVIGLYAIVSTRPVECKIGGCQLKIVTSVNFMDVSQQAVNKFAKAPVVKIRLPPDFFYPFSSSSGPKKTKNVILVFFSLVLFFVKYTREPLTFATVSHSLHG